MKTLVIHFARFGPYHHARLKAAAEVLKPYGWEVTGLETAGNDSTYAWDQAGGGGSGPRVITAFPGRVHEEITAAEYRKVLIPLLTALNPDAMVIAGWGSTDAQLCLSWCRKNDKRRIVMSETRKADGKRVWWKETLKSRLIRRFDGALVGGKSQRDYLVKLGMPEEKIRLGYNVVDNVYFAAEAAKYRSLGASEADVSEMPRYFLASNRFIERKNLSRLIEAYAEYTREASDGHRPPLQCWPLCLLGDGELKADLIAQCHELGLPVAECAPWESDRNTETPKHRNTVYFPGFRQIEELPRFYAHAGCFVHPALEEPWGLVINEAMACGLPVLSGTNVGAAEELVNDGVNGWMFDAENADELTELMLRISACNFALAAFGDASVRILDERCPTEAFGRGLAGILKAP